MDARIIVGAEGFFRVEERSGLRTRCRGGGARTTLTLFPRVASALVWTCMDITRRGPAPQYLIAALQIYDRGLQRTLRYIS